MHCCLALATLRAMMTAIACQHQLAVRLARAPSIVIAVNALLIHLLVRQIRHAALIQTVQRERLVAMGAKDAELARLIYVPRLTIMSHA